MILNEDYKFRDDLAKKETDTVPIELLGGPFAGIVFKFDRVELREAEDHARVKFEYTLIEHKDFIETKLRADKTFTQVLGLVLNTIMLEFVDIDSNRETDTEELIEDGIIHT